MPPETPLDPPGEDRPLRRDAARNRALILETAAEVFAEHGLDAGYDEIARRAGVGVGTVYRRFPERAELVRALFESRIHEVVAVAEASATMGGWDGLVHFVEQTAVLQAADRGLREVLASLPDEVHHAVGRDLLTDVVDRLVARAHDDGALRPEVSATDLGVLLALLSSVTTTDEPELWRRYLALALDGLRARPGQDPLPLAAPTEDAIHELMGNLNGR